MMTTHRWDLPFTAGAAAVARTCVEELLTTNGAAVNVVETATLLISEVVSNAVKHGTGPLSLYVAEVSGGWQLRVSDCSEETPVVRENSLDREGGRGLMLVEILARAWGTDAHPHGGKDVWFTL
jgi:anti-sigma regulatory factor (Ser/Thr protein kinase)